MKNIFKYLSLSIIALILNSCEDENNFKILEPEDASFEIVTPSTGTSIILSEATPNNPAVTFTWEPAIYTVPTAVTYTVQFAKNGTNFAAPVDITTSPTTNATVNVAELNLNSLLLGVAPFTEGTIDVRIKATVGTTGAEPQYSNSITLSVTPFGCLNQYAVGAGLVGAGWNWNSPVVLFCNDNVLTSTVDFANDSFRFFTTEGDWGSGRNYPYYTGAGYVINSTLVNANDGDSNFRFTGTPGTHRLKIDENNKTITAFQGSNTNSSYWLVGAATPGGWSWAGDNETELGKIDTGIYEVPVELKNNEAFRVWFANDGGDSWGSPNRNFPGYIADGYTISADFVNANDGDSNFRYVGTTATKRFKIDTVNKTITFN
ncbi:SusE domain-containing protein [Flavobacterium amniphilum]|uniref:SusE domain-containing protein n=1 Tax=Flavobacterium amniphilum TaxID=1834035 RepID=UPI00202A8F1D|nr:SusE domain-containing protein [Flavobacterium amniphilum]MCL9806495.1 SusE domain-containing protein [Flavobacterium amniphilum]